MSLVQTVLQGGALILGFVSALLWFWSARVTFEKVEALGPLSDGSIALKTEDGFLQLDLPKQGKLNAWAALATGSSVLLQALFTLAPHINGG